MPDTRLEIPPTDKNGQDFVETHHPAETQPPSHGAAQSKPQEAKPQEVSGDTVLNLRPPRRLWILGLGATLAALALAVYGVADRSWSESEVAQLTAEEAIPTVSVIHPEQGSSDEELSLPGAIEAWYQASIYARVSGYLKMWYADIGARVKAGELLATIETPDLDQELAQSKANLGVAEANYRLAQVTATRWRKLLKSDAVSVQDADVKAGDAAARLAEVTAAQANVARLDAMEGFKRIVAPFDGIITARRTDVGALSNAGSGTGPELFAVADVQKMRVYVRVPQAESAEVKTGMQADIVVPQWPDRKFPATVDTTANSIDRASNTLLVELVVDNANDDLSPGTFASVHFKLPPDPHVVRIPTSALLFRKGGLSVATLAPDGRAAIKRIRAGRDLGTQMEVVAGLSPSDNVINSPPDSLIAGEKIRVAGSNVASGGRKPMSLADK
jgi:RND family efflux transporter MFP subunit